MIKTYDVRSQLQRCDVIMSAIIMPPPVGKGTVSVVFFSFRPSRT